MINKKNLLGKEPIELGVKDAIHTAIVSVRAACYLDRAEYVKINERGEATTASKKDSVGVVDPFGPDKVDKGANFWLIINQSDIPNVQHVWDHPSISFEAPTCEVEPNKWIKEYHADELGIDYWELMKAANRYVYDDRRTDFSSASQEKLDFVEDHEWGEFWSEWADEVGHEFENYGSSCCPEYDYPDCPFRPILSFSI